ncbi:WD repeat-containing protein WRAP73 [Halyomorpha halys]|uniref:WD repeat-containing protein WRAP73 n=1 Tax=Halyomorpha halys TaxID=286706 RepID=UPI0006D4E232|nr:uncharacterized protein LOC106678652 [Halyomorpha halys]
MFTDVYTVALWTSCGKFVVQSLLGEKKFSMASSISSRIKAVELCRERRVLAIATFDDKVELFDVLSWEKLYSFEYPLTLDSKSSNIWGENTIDFQYSEKQLFIDNEFQKKTILSLSAIKNMNDEFKIKSNLKFRLSYSKGNKFLASYTPGFPNVVWIRSLKNKKIAGVISLNEKNIQGLRWHPTREILAVLTSDSIIFWNESCTSVIYCKHLLTSFHWINTKLIICGIATEEECILVYFRQR